MTVLWAANSDAPWLRSGPTPYTSTRAGTFDPNAGRNSMMLHVSRQYAAFFNASVASFWASFQMWMESNTTAHDNAIFVVLGSATSIMRIMLVNAVWTLERRLGASWETVASGLVWPQIAQRSRVTIEYVAHASTGVFNIYSSDILWLSFTGDTLGDTGQTEATRIQMVSPSGANTNDLSRVYFSEFHADTTPAPRDGRVLDLPLTAAGNDQAWAGTVADINAIEIDDTTAIQSDTNDQVANYVAGDINAAFSGMSPLGVSLTHRAKQVAGGPLQLQAHVRPLTTNRFGATKAVATTLGSIMTDFPTNPETGLPWTRAEIDATEYGVKSIA